MPGDGDPHRHLDRARGSADFSENRAQSRLRELTRGARDDAVEPGLLVEVEAQLGFESAVDALRQARALIQPIADLLIEPRDLFPQLRDLPPSLRHLEPQEPLAAGLAAGVLDAAGAAAGLVSELAPLVSVPEGFASVELAVALTEVAPSLSEPESFLPPLEEL